MDAKQKDLQQSESFMLGCSAHESAVDGLGFYSEFPAPLCQDHSPAVMFNPSRITADVGSSYWCMSLNNSEGFQFRPPSLKSAMYGVNVDAKNLRPFDHRLYFAANRNWMAVASVALLRFSTDPSAVAFVVPKSVVYTVNGESVRRLTHIAQEVSKVSPLLAHGYSSTSVVSPLFEVLVGTALDHAVPYLISLRPMRSMLSTSDGRQLSSQAATTLCLPGVKVLCRCDGNVPALTNAIPSLLSCNRNHGKASKYISNGHSTFTRRIARMRAEKSVPSREPRAGKGSSAVRTKFGNYRHITSTKDVAGIVTV